MLAPLPYRSCRLLEQHLQETVVLHLEFEPIPNAATFPHPRLIVQLKVASSPPVLRSIHFTHTSGSGSPSESLLTALLQHVDLSGVWKLRSCEGLGHFWATCVEAPTQWASVKNLNLSSCGLVALPASIGQLGSLRVLRLNHNKLTSLPPEIGQLTELEVLSVNHNTLSTLPGGAGQAWLAALKPFSADAAAVVDLCCCPVSIDTQWEPAATAELPSCSNFQCRLQQRMCRQPAALCGMGCCWARQS